MFTLLTPDLDQEKTKRLNWQTDPRGWNLSFPSVWTFHSRSTRRKTYLPFTVCDLTEIMSPAMEIAWLSQCLHDTRRSTQFDSSQQFRIKRAETKVTRKWLLWFMTESSVFSLINTSSVKIFHVRWKYQFRSLDLFRLLFLLLTNFWLFSTEKCCLRGTTELKWQANFQ